MTCEETENEPEGNGTLNSFLINIFQQDRPKIRQLQPIGHIQRMLVCTHEVRLEHKYAHLHMYFLRLLSASVVVILLQQRRMTHKLRIFAIGPFTEKSLWTSGLRKRKERLEKLKELSRVAKKKKKRKLKMCIFLALVYSTCSETNTCLMYPSLKMFPSQ